MSIQAIFMVYNCDDLIYDTLKSYVNFVDRIIVFIDNKSNDKTERQVKNLKNELGKNFISIQKFDFVRFDKSRNECLNRSYDLRYTWTIFPDDSYVLITRNQNSLRQELMGYELDSSVNCISVWIHGEHASYKSKRIIRTWSKIRYTNRIHEELASNEDKILNDSAFNDIKNDRSINRSLERVYKDIKALDGLNDGRSMYYRASMYIQLYHLGRIKIEECMSKFSEYLVKTKEIGYDYPEERFICWVHLGNLWTIKIQNQDNSDVIEDGIKESIKCYLQAALDFPIRSGECYYYIYLLTGIRHWINKAYEHRDIQLKLVNMPINQDIYTQIKKVYLDISESEKLVNN